MRFLPALALICSLGCSAPLARAPLPSGTISHVVVCYLKTPGDAVARQKIVEAARTFRQIPGVLSVEVGQPLLPSTRPVVVKDYDVACVITLKSRAALAAYAPHPIHQKAVTEVLNPLAAKIVIYDIVGE
ncbi:MAG: Dabb family protein [Phycisphaerae bacterium]|nr:Dabb family protein [Tepidisphaeraceae bacterium]